MNRSNHSQNEPSGNGHSPRDEFEKLNEHKELSIIHEFILFLKENKKWWLIPILLVFGIVGLLILLGASGAAPFIYTLF